MTADPDAASPQQLQLRWPVRTSFLRYVANLPDGRASVSDGAALTVDDPQTVVYEPDAANTCGTVLAFRGDLRLGGHGGLLFVRLAHPWIVLAGERAELVVDDPSTEDGSGARIPLVTLVMQRDGEGWSGTDVRLTPEGVGVFNHVYAADEPFDSLSLAPRRAGVAE